MTLIHYHGTGALDGHVIVTGYKDAILGQIVKKRVGRRNRWVFIAIDEALFTTECLDELNTLLKNFEERCR